MHDSSLWRALIGVENTVIEGVEYDAEARTLVVSVRPAAQRRRRCGRCQARSPGYDSGRGRRQWRTLDLGTIRTWLEADSPRVKCPTHGVVVAHVPWARHGAGSTRVFDEQVAWLATETSKHAVTELMRVAWRTVGAVITRVWAEVTASTDMLGGLTKIGIDEVSYRRGRLFLMVVIDHDTGRLVWAGEGQSKATLQGFFDELGPKRCAQIGYVTADSAGYIADVVAKNCPTAVQAADPFHVVKWANDALGEVRLDVWRETRRAARANSQGRGRAPLDVGDPFPAHSASRFSPARATRCGRTPRTSPRTNEPNSTGSPRPTTGSGGPTNSKRRSASSSNSPTTRPPRHSTPGSDQPATARSPSSSTSPAWSKHNADRSS